MSDVPAIVQEWVRQLLDPEFVELVRARSGGQVEVRLYSNRGKIRRKPTVLLDAGPQELVAPESE